MEVIRAGDSAWSPGYFVSYVKIDVMTIKRYVEHQGRQDSDPFRMEL